MNVVNLAVNLKFGLTGLVERGELLEELCNGGRAADDLI